MVEIEGWPEIRRAVRERDRNKCMNCGTENPEISLDVHHIVPRGNGGSNRLSNLILLCRQCHDAAHDKGMAPTVEFKSSGEMKDGEFEVFRQFFQNVPSAIFDQETKVWRIPKGDLEQLTESMGNPIGLKDGTE